MPSKITESRVSVDFDEFTAEDLIFDPHPSIDDRSFVQEVIVQHQQNDDGTFSWITPLPINDSRQVKFFLDKILSQKSHPRLFRGTVEFYIFFKYAIDIDKSLDEIILKLEELTNLVQTLQEWIRSKQAQLLCDDHGSGILSFLVTNEVFSEACTKFSWTINENEVVVLAQK